MNRSLRKGLCIRLAAAALAVLTLTAALGAGARTVYASEVTAMSKQSAKLKGDSINTRSGAGTNYDKVEALPGGTEVTVTGQATDSDGQVWYQVTLPSGKTAFVRNDLLELGEVIEEEPAEPVEPEPVEPEPVEPEPEPEPEPEEPATPIVSSQYVAVYEEDDQGVYYWYLHDNDGGYRVKIDDLLAAARSVEEYEAIEKQNKTLKTVLIVLGILLVLFLVIIVVLIFRLRDYMYYEEDEEEEEEEPRRGSFVKRRRDEDLIDEEEETPRTARNRAAAGRSGRDYAEEQARSARNARGQEARGRESSQTRKARSVMREDDDFEYEFLNLDDEKK